MIFESIKEFITDTGIMNMDYKSAIMLLVAVIFLYLAINRGFEPLLLTPIAFGMLLSNLPIRDYPLFVTFGDFVGIEAGT